jgi:hypothetical protein
VPNSDQADDDFDGVGSACDADCGTSIGLKDSVKVKATTVDGLITAKLTVALAAYSGEPVTVRLDDSDSSPIVSQTLATIPPKGTKGNTWQYKVKPDGLRVVQLKSLAPRHPGQFQVKVKAKHWAWFPGESANLAAANTTLTVTIGSSCYSHMVTTKK